jgi:Nucleotidyltransferase/DNA polymerase involved in DNA repair
MKMYLCIDLKSFYASVECVERGLDPMTANLVVADPERSDKTICLAVSPSMKALGVKNRCRVFEIPRNIDYIMAEPRMQKYIDYAAEIYGIYLKYISKDDIHVYSIDEAFIDVSPYLKTYGKNAKEMAEFLMGEVYRETGIRATCGIGTNLYLTKIALDITAKHSSDFIGYLDEELYIKTLWDHRPLTDFWRIGPGIAKRLENCNIFTMGQLAHADEELLYGTFGIDAELLIDHAWGREPVTIADIKAYKSKTNSITSGQVLMRDYSFEEGKLIIRKIPKSNDGKLS